MEEVISEGLEWNRRHMCACLSNQHSPMFSGCMHKDGSRHIQLEDLCQEILMGNQYQEKTVVLLRSVRPIRNFKLLNTHPYNVFLLPPLGLTICTNRQSFLFCSY